MIGLFKGSTRDIRLTLVSDRDRLQNLASTSRFVNFSACNRVPVEGDREPLLIIVGIIRRPTD